MEKSVRHFDMEHQLLRNENLRLSMQLNMADLEQLMLFQELLILEESKTKRDALQQKLNTCIKEENSIVVGAVVSLSTQMMFSYLLLVAFSPRPMQMVGAVFVKCLRFCTFSVPVVMLLFLSIPTVQVKGGYPTA